MFLIKYIFIISINKYAYHKANFSGENFMKLFIILMFALFMATTSFASNFSQNTKLKEGKVIKSEDHADFKKLNAFIKEFAISGFPCMQKKIAKLKKSKTEKEIRSMSADEQKKIQEEFTKECMCTSKAKKASNEINNLLNKHSDWIGQTITYKKQGNSSVNLDLTTMKLVIENFSRICGK